MVEREHDRSRETLDGFKAFVHGVERGSYGEDGDYDADHDGDLLLLRSGFDEVAGLEILRGVAGVGGGDADDSTDGDGEGSEGGGGPAFDEEDGGGGHQRRDGHAGDGRGGAAHDADDARDDGYEEEAEDDDQESGGDVGERADLRSWDGFELEEEKHQEDEEKGAAEDDDGRKVVLDAGGLGCGCFASAGFLEALSECADDGGEGAEESDESGCGDSACSHRTDVGAPEIGGGHLGDEDRAGVERGGEVRAEEVDGRHEDEPRENSAGEHDGGDADADDVTDAEVLGGAVGADGSAFEQVLGAQVEVSVRSGRPEGEEILVLEEGVDAAEAEAEEDTGGEAAATLAGDEDVGAGGAFGVDEGVVFIDDELAAQGNHEENAEPASEEGEGEDARRLEVEA